MNLIRRYIILFIQPRGNSGISFSLCELCSWNKACNHQALLHSRISTSIYEAEFWVLMALIIWEGMYQALAWQSSVVALEPCIQLLVQNCGISTFLCQKLLIKKCNPREVPERGSILRGREGTEKLVCQQQVLHSWNDVGFLPLEENFKSKYCVKKGSLVNKFEEGVDILQMSEKELSFSR